MFSLLFPTTQKVCVFVSIMCWPCNLVSCIAEMSTLYQINWWVNISNESILNNVPTFRDPVNVLVLRCLIHCLFLWMYLRLLLNLLHTSFSYGVEMKMPGSPFLHFLDLGPVRNQQLRSRWDFWKQLKNDIHCLCIWDESSTVFQIFFFFGVNVCRFLLTKEMTSEQIPEPNLFVSRGAHVLLYCLTSF
jgi:hypothetical protein